MFYSLQRLCAALHFGVGKLSSEVGREAGVAFDKTVVASLANAAFEKVRFLRMVAIFAYTKDRLRIYFTRQNGD